MSTRSKAYLNALMPGLQGALVYPLSDKKSLRFAIDQFILFFAYDDPFDEEALTLDEGTATKFTNAIVSVITDIESFQPIPKFPVITAYHEYVFFFIFSPKAGCYKQRSLFWRARALALFHSFFVRLRAESTASAYKRFVDETVESILSVNSQVEMRARGKHPNIKEYLLLRRSTTGMKVACFFSPLWSFDPRFWC